MRNARKSPYRPAFLKNLQSCAAAHEKEQQGIGIGIPISHRKIQPNFPLWAARLLRYFMLEESTARVPSRVSLRAPVSHRYSLLSARMTRPRPVICGLSMMSGVTSWILLVNAHARIAARLFQSRVDYRRSCRPGLRMNGLSHG